MLHLVPALLLSLLSAALPTGDDPLPELCARFHAFDQNGDGAAEIASLEVTAAAGEAGPEVLVLVERRLLEPLDGAVELGPPIERLVQDLAAEGHRAHAIAVALAPGELHQDGRYVLALRELLRAVAAERDLAGALLVGHFPDAYLVRTCNWRKQENVTLLEGTAAQMTYANAPYLRRVPEGVADRAEIVLCDLDGRWEGVYVQPRTRLVSTRAVFDGGIPEHGGACTDLEQGGVVFEDFFHVSDGRLEVSEELAGDGSVRARHVALFDSSGDLECGAADRALPNVMAHPDVLVSRIDARGVALRPRPDVVGVDGGGLLDEAGMPRAVRFASKELVPDWHDGIWEADPALERELLVEFLDRDHAYRTGTAAVAWRPASIACGLGSGYGVVARASAGWESADRDSLDLGNDATLEDLVDWLGRGAILRTLRAHSDPTGSVFGATGVTALDARFPRGVWSWTPRGEALVPSLEAACGGGRLEWFLLRTLHENALVADSPALWVHTGCDGISPPGARQLAYDDPRYGRRQGAESLLFFTNGLALVGRAKVFYDEPRGFAEGLREGETFGAAWARYFDVESRAVRWDEVGGDIGRKRAYFWSVLGDWTLRLSR